MTEEEAMRLPAVPKKQRKGRHPLAALFGTMRTGIEDGMRFITDRGGLCSDLWERYPEPEEVTWADVLRCFEAAKSRLNPEWCDEWITSIKSKILS